ncbi:MAG: hypothetical protein RMM06_07225 [Armatimonadota bacterium]|nr:hypothetical protein [bacterium]MCS7310317.1 hypothetical protein [Armatimonadota bacterium]MDW8105134.1 hypothetical protein [Armatimonadota bacterium]MDW8290500.1 hypothetical protein [Armatimonadota bacterium]
MDKAMVPLLILLTSVLGYGVARRLWQVDRASLARAWHRAMELLGCWALVYLANLFVGATFILLIRLLTDHFVSLYVLGSIMLILWSVLQALVFYFLWRERQ